MCQSARPFPGCLDGVGHRPKNRGKGTEDMEEDGELDGYRPSVHVARSPIARQPGQEVSGCPRAG